MTGALETPLVRVAEFVCRGCRCTVHVYAEPGEDTSAFVLATHCDECLDLVAERVLCADPT